MARFENFQEDPQLGFLSLALLWVVAVCALMLIGAVRRPTPATCP